MAKQSSVVDATTSKPAKNPPRGEKGRLLSHASEIGQSGLALPLHGLSRWRQIEPFSPVSREKWRQLVIEGKAPQPIHLGPRTSCYQNRELHKFFADPLNYRAEPTARAA